LPACDVFIWYGRGSWLFIHTSTCGWSWEDVVGLILEEVSSKPRGVE